MSKTIRELTLSTPVTASNIMAVSREDTPFAFKTDVDEIKDYALTSGGTIASFLEVTTSSGVVKATGTQLQLFVSSTNLSAVIDAGGIYCDRVRGLTRLGSYIDLGDTFDFSLSNVVVAKITSTGIECDKFRGLAAAGTYIDLSAGIEFYVGSSKIAKIDSTGLTVDYVVGATTPGNYLDFYGTGGDSIRIVSGGTTALECFQNGEVNFPKRNVISAWEADPGIQVLTDTGTLLNFSDKSADPLVQYNDITNKFAIVRVGLPMQFTIQLTLTSKAWTASEYIVVYYEDSSPTNIGAGTGAMYFQTATYIADVTFTGFFISSANPKGIWAYLSDPTTVATTVNRLDIISLT